ncbi:protein transport protein-related [Musa troglodytarum]|uniref:Protein transport protein-related n=1 Tax=Musa troglodytarum TaxID=320322 RepID=A0A9E7K236_9LILI|nr:protein transport protein-related [Musa troglodytarum]
MLFSKSKSGLSEASVNKGTPATPRAGKSGRGGSTKADPFSPSPQQPSRASIDRSPKSVESRPTIEHRSPKITTTDKRPRSVKGLELQTQLSAAQEDLKKAKEHLASVEKEKSQILEELKSAKKSAGEANDKLQDALVAQRIAEEASEIDKFRADELEQAGIDAAQKKEEEWEKELEIVRNQHALDVAALLSTTQELQRMKQELAMTAEAKNSALVHADDAMKIAEINADKVELLSREVSHLKALLDSAVEGKNTEASELAEKEMDLKAMLNLAQEDLKKSNEQLVSAKAEKTHILKELNEAKRLADEASERHKENLAAQERAEEDLEAYKIRASNLEQDNIRSAQKREEEWRTKLEIVENQHALNVAKLLSTTEELEKVQHELRMAIDAKDTALIHASEAVRSAEINSEKLELLSGKASQLKALLDSKLELDLEVFTLKSELEKAKAAEERLVEMEATIEGLRIEVIDAKKAESDTNCLMAEWKKKTGLLGVQLEEANELRKTSLETLASVMKQLEDNNAVLQDKEREVAALGAQVGSLRLEVARRTTELNESSQHLGVAQQETAEMGKMIAVLKSELQIAEEAKIHALNNEKAAILNMQQLTEERNKLENELDVAQCELEKDQKAMEGLASALHEVSTEVHETRERLLTKQSEVEDCDAQIEELKVTVKKNQESYEIITEKAKHEIVSVQNTAERLEKEIENSRSELDSKVLHFVNSIKRSEEEITTMRADMKKITDSLKGAELGERAAKEEELRIFDKLKHLESEAGSASITAEEANAESLRLKEMLLDKENELQGIIQENDDLRVRETAALEKVKELSSLVAEAASKKPEQNGEISRNSKHSGLTVSVDSSAENTGDEGGAQKANSQVPLEKLEEHSSDKVITEEERTYNGALEEEETDVEGPKWENCKTLGKDLSTEREHETESTYEELDSKMDVVSLDITNGLTPGNIENGATLPSKQQQQQQQKKKKAFMQRVGSLLKKKSNK